jgi:hypothetical protein
VRAGRPPGDTNQTRAAVRAAPTENAYHPSRSLSRAVCPVWGHGSDDKSPGAPV